MPLCNLKRILKGIVYGNVVLMKSVSYCIAKKCMYTWLVNNVVLSANNTHLSDAADNKITVKHLKLLNLAKILAAKQ